ncbi:sulfite exporter TauE/SafE family protein [Actinoalloteichus caeruleus]|uniref:Probable membrane transporter protein n=1 Tax=Actinoalloteichus caeruleus DSM 43889 TaxID=1120930 RepID=A0ABT1JBS6_ACTCY|nr:sulfite exporter TauE/SafE family protein [Actinoalloteichus caeruleus]MCP2329948.1 hypothetical protein [Actinoalloteichus caeruleus DSM 43889]
MSLAALFVAGVIVMVGATIQGAVGLGMNLLAAPFLIMIAPELVPVPLLVVGTLHAAMTLVREHRSTDWGGVGWAMIGRAAGTAVGVWAVVWLPQREFSVVVGVSVLVCVVLSVLSWRPSPTRGALLVAGTAGGVFGTASSIGGPPVALLYQREKGPKVRATMGAYFCLGSTLSVLALAVGGQVGTTELVAAAALLPFLLAGFALSGPLRRVVDAGLLRRALLGVTAFSAVLLIARSLFW